MIFFVGLFYQIDTSDHLNGSIKEWTTSVQDYTLLKCSDQDQRLDSVGRSAPLLGTETSVGVSGSDETSSCQTVCGNYGPTSNGTFGFNKNHPRGNLQRAESNLLASLPPRVRVKMKCALCARLAQLLSFFHSPTGFRSSRASIGARDAPCGIGWGGGAGPAPRASRATGEECAGEGEGAACAAQGRRQEEIRAVSEVDESPPLVFKWVFDDSSRKMSLDISPAAPWWREEINFMCRRCQDCQRECRKNMVFEVLKLWGGGRYRSVKSVYG